MNIKIRFEKSSYPIEIIEEGDWIDLRTTEEIRLKAPSVKSIKVKEGDEEHKPIFKRQVVFDSKIASLGVAMELPKGFEAWVLPRSSTPLKWHIMLMNSKGIIDNEYNGDEDYWRFQMIALDDVVIPAGTRIAQFRVALSQKATRWQKLRWLFSNGITISIVDRFGNKNRGGIGSTGER